MALARIITRSQECSRELALDLLARGYAVEVVSPDRVPDNFADLELRVDADANNQLIANVATHDGERSTALDFVHHLKAPMGDFIRRPPQPREALLFSEEPVIFNADPRIRDVEPLAENLQQVTRLVPPIKVSRAAETTIAVSKIVAPMISAPIAAPISAPTMAVSKFPAPVVAVSKIAAPTIGVSTTAVSTIAETTTAESTTVLPKIAAPLRIEEAVVPKPIPPSPLPTNSHPQWPDLFLGRFWRAGLTFATIMLLALVLGFGMRRPGKPDAGRSATIPAPPVAAASTDPPSNDLKSSKPVAPEEDVKTNQAKVPPQVSALASPPAAIPTETNSVPAVKAIPTTAPRTALAATTRAKAPASRPRHNEVIARDTVTYLDKRFQPAPKTTAAKRAAPHPPASHKHSNGVIAANSVTYLNGKSSPKSPK
jgi:hypothetical protein